MNESASAAEVVGDPIRFRHWWMWRIGDRRQDEAIIVAAIAAGLVRSGCGMLALTSAGRAIVHRGKPAVATAEVLLMRARSVLNTALADVAEQEQGMIRALLSDIDHWMARQRGIVRERDAPGSGTASDERGAPGAAGDPADGVDPGADLSL